MFKFRKSLGFRIFALSILLLVIPLLIDSFIIMLRERKNAIQNAKNNLMEIANLRELSLAKVEPISKEFINILENELKLKENFPKEPNPKLTEDLTVWSKLAEVYAIFVVALENDQEKIVGSNIPGFLGKNLSEIMIINNIILEKNFVSQVAYDYVTAAPFFIITKTIRDPETEKIKGFILITDHLNLTEKLELLLRAEKGTFPISFAFLDEDEFVIAASDSAMQLHYFNKLSLNKIKKIIHSHFLELPSFDESKLTKDFIETVPNIVTPPLFAFKWGNEIQIGYIKSIPNSRYSLLAYSPRDSILTNPMGSHLDEYGVYLAILVIGSALSFLIVRRMARPIAHLAKVMTNIQQGNLVSRYQIDLWGFEINGLGLIFNNMLDALIENQNNAVTERVKKEGYEQELKLGRQAQLSLLPQKMPTLSGVEISERYIPAIEVGGDFYDVFIMNKNGEKCVYLIIADASGKGVQACFYSLSARSMIRTYAKYYDQIDKVMQATNALFCNDVGDTGMFITVAAAIYHTNTRELEYYFSGHNPGFIRRKNGAIETLHFQDIAMGLLVDTTAKAEKIQLEKGDLLLFYTDGITEAHDKEQKLFGEQRLKEFLAAADRSAHELVDGIVNEVNAFAKGRLQHDDITLLAMKIIEEDDEKIVCT